MRAASALLGAGEVLVTGLAAVVLFTAAGRLAPRAPDETAPAPVGGYSVVDVDRDTHARVELVRELDLLRVNRCWHTTVRPSWAPAWPVGTVYTVRHPGHPRLDHAVYSEDPDAVGAALESIEHPDPHLTVHGFCAGPAR